MPDTDSMKMNKELTIRQASHSKRTRPCMTSNIAIDLDYPLLSKKGRTSTLHEMILNLKARNKGITKGLRLFHSVDFIKDDSIDLLINSSKGPGWTST